MFCFIHNDRAFSRHCVSSQVLLMVIWYFTLTELNAKSFACESTNTFCIYNQTKKLLMFSHINGWVTIIFNHQTQSMNKCKQHRLFPQQKKTFRKVIQILVKFAEKYNSNKHHANSTRYSMVLRTCLIEFQMNHHHLTSLDTFWFSSITTFMKQT